MPFVVLAAVYGMCAIIFAIDLLIKKMCHSNSMIKSNAKDASLEEKANESFPSSTSELLLNAEDNKSSLVSEK